MVERFNRTLEGHMYRYFTAANTLKYINILPDLARGYNASYHRSIRRAPPEMTHPHEKDMWKTLYGPRLTSQRKPTPQFRVGDRVRISQARRPFKKGYLPQWTEEVFEVRRMVVESIGPVTYKLKELDGTHVDDNTVWRIENVYVQWKGWPKKYNSWIRKQDLA